MGDSICITTWPKHQNLFYLVTSNGLLFDVKAQGYASIGLARKPGPKIDYWIGIGDSGKCWIRKDDNNSKSVNVNNILSADYYTKFWLQWNAGFIKLGRYNDTKPIVTYTNKIPDLKYITFGVLNHINPVHWRFDLPPVRPSIQLNKPISKGKLEWVTATDQLPDGALIGGFEKEVLYIIKAEHRGSETPGKFVPSEGVGYISWGGNANEKSEFSVLCGFDCSWVPTSEDRIPVGAFVGGFSEDRQERLYIGRAMHNGHMIPGKVQPSHKMCYIPFDGREIAKKKYEILVEPKDLRCVNETLMSDININESASESDEDEDDTWQPGDDDDYDDDNNIFGYNSDDEMNGVMAL